MCTEAKTGIFLALLSLAGVGARTVFPQHKEIGWGLIVISIIGFIFLAFHHYRLGFRSSSPIFGTVLLGIIFIGFPAGFIIHSFIEQIEITPKTPKSASECKPENSLEITPSYLMDLYKKRTKLQGDELAAAYIGKCIFITGKLRDTIPLEYPPGAFFVIIVDNAGKWLSANFSAESSETVRHIPRNAVITVHGEIYSVSESDLKLRGSKLEGINQN
jgi:hypothetical protein